MGSQRRARSMSLKYRWGNWGLKRGRVIGDKAGSRIQIHVPGMRLLLLLITLSCSASVYQSQVGEYKTLKQSPASPLTPRSHGGLYYSLHHLLLLPHSHLLLIVLHVGGGTWYLAQGPDNFNILSYHSDCWVPRTHHSQWFAWPLVGLWERA